MSARAREPMPDEIAEALAAKGLREAYDERPTYQRNDYLRWIRTAKRDETTARRLTRMLDELKGGTRYMNMKWRAKVAS